MNKQLIKAILKVLGDGQAFLYAHSLQQDAEMLGETVSDEQFEAWEDDWKKESVELVEKILNNEDNIITDS